MTSRPAARRLSVPLSIAMVLALVMPLVAGLQQPSSQAATFRAGMIISDDVFYNNQAMSTAEVQAFLNEKGASCVPGSTGTPCLKNYRQTTWTRGADTRCTGAYQGAANESAATIITKVANACRINPQVLLVLLQKEQGLVTATGSYLTPRRYEAATGYGCPDTAPCDAEFRGFYNQVYKAAWQFRSYALNPYNFAHVPGRASQMISLHPNAACGKVNVYIQNQATASLYNYTPYTPNAAVLNGAADGCSSYGNLNFLNFFTQWFGSTEYTVFGAIGAYWSSNKAALGSPMSNERAGLARGGVLQTFRNGTVYWTPSTGAHSLRGGVLTFWSNQGWENGYLGYPTTDEKKLARASGVVQSFEGGHVYWSTVGGAQSVRGTIGARWAALGWENSTLGYPITSQRALRSGGLVQSFEKGHIYWSAVGGAQPVSPVMAARWASLAWEEGPLGYPVSAERSLRDKGKVQSFAGGALYQGPSGVVQPVRGGILGWWAERGWENSSFGYPTTGERTGLRGGGAVQSFERGAVYWTPMYGPKGLSGPILTWWASAGWENGRLGYATSEATTSAGTTTQSFEGGQLRLDVRTGTVTVAYR